ncbi:potassium-transporting ATPase subunit KdpC [Ectobacillus sp. sgz5001026]|uniref:potassium-transporting ATPase subunit KdpC n=1 Tax=Ectobacillus sp. sgz5001026 TaxID=3242473 RepID=UPI0036D3D9DF
MKPIITALRAAIVLLIISGLLYPVITTGVAQVLFPKQAEGSLVVQDGKVQGSILLAQEFKGDEWFHSRASAANYDPKASAATNAAIASADYKKTITESVNQLKKENLNIGASVPADIVTTSGSGFDPDVSPEGAKAQVPHVSQATGITQEQLLSLIDSHTNGRQLGLFGEPRVNILELNLVLQQMKK